MADIGTEDLSAHGLAYEKWHTSTRIADILDLDHVIPGTSNHWYIPVESLSVPYEL
jgi:hypothetical protein